MKDDKHSHLHRTAAAGKAFMYIFFVSPKISIDGDGTYRWQVCSGLHSQLHRFRAMGTRFPAQKRFGKLIKSWWKTRTLKILIFLIILRQRVFPENCCLPPRSKLSRWMRTLMSGWKPHQGVTHRDWLGWQLLANRTPSRQHKQTQTKRATTK